MKILHLISSLDPANGGPPRVAIGLSAALAGLGHEICLASLIGGSRSIEIERSMQSIPGADRVNRTELPAPCDLFDAMTVRTVRQPLAELLSQCDFLHIHGVWDPILRVGAAMARRHRRSYCVTPHGMLDPWSLAQKRLKKRVALILGYRRMLQDAAFLHVLNVDEARLLAPLKLRCPSHVIPNGVFLEEIDPLPARGLFQAANPQLQSRPFVLFLSRLHYKKGLDYLADAFALTARRHPDVQLVVAGPDGGEAGPFRNRITMLGLADRVHIVGPIYGTKKYEAMVDAAVFCLPSRQEGFSMAITEAMACGTPVVISEACHFPEVADAGAGIIVPLNPARIADAVDRCLSNPELRYSMGLAGRRLVHGKYTWPVIAARMIDAYASAGRR